MNFKAEANIWFQTSKATELGLLESVIAGENGELGVGKISVLMNAEVPTVENGSNMWMKVALATLVGFAAAVAIVYIRYITDDRIKTQEDILRSYNVPVLGVIPPEIIQ